MLHTNAHRRRNVHLVVFVIVLVANASITPLGNPPLYIGLLLGVPFFWPVRTLFGPLLVITLLLLATFYLIDRRLASTEPAPPERQRFHFRGWRNVGLILAAILVILLEGMVPVGKLVLLGTPVGNAELAGNAILIALTLVSIRITPRAIRQPTTSPGIRSWRSRCCSLPSSSRSARWSLCCMPAAGAAGSVAAADADGAGE
jgi:Na+/H+ antiporter NhaD/arsenite permease-like protein